MLVAVIVAGLAALMLLAGIIYAIRIRRFQKPVYDHEAAVDKADAIVNESSVGFR